MYMYSSLIGIHVHVHVYTCTLTTGVYVLSLSICNTCLSRCFNRCIIDIADIMDQR